MTQGCTTAVEPSTDGKGALHLAGGVCGKPAVRAIMLGCDVPHMYEVAVCAAHDPADSPRRQLCTYCFSAGRLREVAVMSRRPLT